MSTKAEKAEKVNQLLEKKIDMNYHRGDEIYAIKKGNEKIKVLYKLLHQEIKKHNSKIRREVKAIRGY